MIAKLLTREGSGPPVAYVPGIDGSGELLLGTAGRVAERFTLMRFHYLPQEEDSYSRLATSLMEGVKAQGFSRCILLTESFGGAVSFQAALDFPDQVCALLVVNSFVYYRRRLRLGLARLTAPLVPEICFHGGRKLFAPWSLFGKRSDPEALAAFRAHCGTYFDQGYRRRLHMIQGLDLRPRLSQIQQPVLLVASDRDKIVDSLRSGREMLEALPHAELQIAEGGGHLILPLRDEPWVQRLEELQAKGRCDR
jgi:pimeloyl-ACP methyl ester carboxylesterase